MPWLVGVVAIGRWAKAPNVAAAGRLAFVGFDAEPFDGGEQVTGDADEVL